MTTVDEDRTQARVDGLLEVLRDAEADFRRSYARVLEVVAELEEEKAGAVAGFDTTARLLTGVLNLSKGEAKARADQAGLLTPRRSLTGEVLPPALPATAAELAAGAIGPSHLRVITATMRRIPPSTHPEVAAQAEQTLATAARRFDPTALARIGQRLLAHLDPDGKAPPEEPETMRELRVRTGPDGVVSLSGKLDPEGGARVLEVLNSLNGRRPPVDGVPDMRSPARRNTPSCTAKDGTPDSTPAGTPNSFPQRPWIPPEHHSTTPSDSKTPNLLYFETAATCPARMVRSGRRVRGTCPTGRRSTKGDAVLGGQASSPRRAGILRSGARRPGR